MIEIVKPTLKDIPAMQKLVEPSVASGVILYRSDNEMANAVRSYFLAKKESELIGFCALHIHTISMAEIRSLVVKEGFRGMGVGKKLVEEAIKEGRKLGVKEILTLTYESEFFKKIGFSEIPKTSIPDQKIWADCIRCKLFPICNEVSLIKKL